MEFIKHANTLTAVVESKILYEEADGDWLNLQGNDRKKYGKSTEMKRCIAYDGVLHQSQNNGKIRRELDNKAAYASFESAKDFRKHKENIIAAVYNTDETELRVKNGDGANWIQKDTSACSRIIELLNLLFSHTFHNIPCTLTGNIKSCIFGYGFSCFTKRLIANHFFDVSAYHFVIKPDRLRTNDFIDKKNMLVFRCIMIYPTIIFNRSKLRACSHKINARKSAH